MHRSNAELYCGAGARGTTQTHAAFMRYAFRADLQARYDRQPQDSAARRAITPKERSH